MVNKDLTACGLGGWSPRFMQRFATNKTFLVVYGLLGTIQAMAFIYFVATLTTLEKRFQIPSQTTGILMTGNEISQILLSLILSYKGGKGNRPAWIAWGVLFSSLSCFILAVPHWVYGPGSNALALTEEHLDTYVLNSTTKKGPERDMNMCSATRTVDAEECAATLMEISVVPLVLVFFSQFVLGIGTSLYFSLGQTYLDDNTKKSSTPMLLGVTMALRTVGPAVGFVLGFFCLSLYIDPSLTPVIERRDPRWLGAWWLGWVILGSVMTVFSFLIAMFPKQLPKTLPIPTFKIEHDYDAIVPEKQENSLYADYRKAEETKQKQVVLSEEYPLRKKDKNKSGTEENVLKDFGAALKRVITNPLLMSNNLTAVFYILGASGYINFYSKYTETQFQASAAQANMISGVTAIVSMVLGFILSGWVISRWKPRTSYLLLWNIFVGVSYLAGEVNMMFLGCDENNMQGNITEQGLLDPTYQCNEDCSCEGVKFAPVCYEEGNMTFFSACHAGCLQTGLDALGKVMYSNCSCLPDALLTVRQGPCKIECSANFILFMVIQCIIQMIGCTGRITTVLINYRSVSTQDKSIAQGLALFMISLLAFIPGPILYGRIIDNTCLIWDNTCGNQGNCWLYDKYSFRVYLNLTATCFTFGAVVFDVVVWYLGRNIKLYEEPPSEGFKS